MYCFVLLSYVWQATGKLELTVAAGRTVTLTTEDLKLAFEFDAAVKSNYAAQADNDILILLDGVSVPS